MLEYRGFVVSSAGWSLAGIQDGLFFRISTHDSVEVIPLASYQIFSNHQQNHDFRVRNAEDDY